jgi:hypothetical protein
MTREKHTQRGIKIISKKTLFYFYPRHLLRVCFLCVCRSDIWVPRSLSMYTAYGRRHIIHRVSTRARSPLRDVGVVTRARANERDARTNDRRNAHGYFFLDDIVMTLTGTRRELVSTASARARIRAGMRFGFSVTRANATRETRETRRRAKAREKCFGFFLGSRALASASRGRRAVVDVRARAVVDGRARADDDGPSTGRGRRVDRTKRRGCQSRDYLLI